MNRKRLIITLSILIVLLSIPLIYFLLIRNSEQSKAMVVPDVEYTQEINIQNNTGGILSNQDVLIQLDTATLISEGKLESESCGAMWFVDTDNGGSSLEYWIEGGCNTSSTQIWVHVPSVSEGEHSIMMHYGNGGYSFGRQSWNGNFIVMSTVSCPEGWTRVSEYDGRFPYGSSTYGVTGGGNHSVVLSTGNATFDYYHNHSYNEIITGNVGTRYKITTGGAPKYRLGHSGHSHILDLLTSFSSSALDISLTPESINETSEDLYAPNYQEIIFCKKEDLNIYINSVVMSEVSSGFDGWNHLSTMDDRLPRGDSSFGSQGGSLTHRHYYPQLKTGKGDRSYKGWFGGDNPKSNCSMPGHTHTIASGTTNTADSMPPYYKMNFLEASSGAVINSGSIVLTDTSDVPIGWEIYSQLIGRFPYGSSNLSGTRTGGSQTHTHKEGFDLSKYKSGITCDMESSGGTNGARSHSHETSYNVVSNGVVTGTIYSTTIYTSSEESNIPPYLSTIFMKRKTSLPVTFGDTNEPQEELSDTQLNWIISNGGLVYSSKGYNYTIPTLSSSSWSQTVQNKLIHFSEIKSDVTNTALIDNLTVPLIALSRSCVDGVESTTCNVSFRISNSEASRTESYYSDLRNAYLNKGALSSDVEVPSQITNNEYTLTGNECSDDSKVCVLDIIGNINVGSEDGTSDYICNRKSLIFVSGNIDIYPDILDQDSQSDACIFIAGGDINIYDGDDKSASGSMVYDEIDAFLISNGRINIFGENNKVTEETENQEGDYVDGILVKGGLIALSSSEDSINISRKTFLNQRQRYPLLVVDYSSKYGVLTTNLFGSQLDITKTIVGFKPY